LVHLGRRLLAGGDVLAVDTRRANVGVFEDAVSAMVHE
jgi:hypothetical protein